MEVDIKKFWGPHVWFTIHTFAVSYDPAVPATKKAFLSFINSCVYLLPCMACREHMIANMKKIPIEGYFGSNETLLLWTYYFHDLVNKSILPQKHSPPFAVVRDYYFKGLNRPCRECGN